MSKENNHTDLLARWLNNDLSAEERKLFEDTSEFDDLKVVVDDVDTWELDSLDLDQGFSKLQERKEEGTSETKVFSITSWYRVAASIALLAVAYLSWDYFFNNKVLIQTSIAEKREIQLPDGSIVTLDAASSLAYTKQNWEENREVFLTGQAFFDVESGSSFITKTDLGTISVLGTQFNVEVSAASFEVRCYEGKVLVASGAENKTLLANEGTQLTNNQLDKYLIEEELDWINGFSSFFQEPLSAVIQDFKKYYEVEIDLPEQYANMSFTGQFTHSNTTSALRSVFATMEIKYVLNDGKVDFE